MRSQYSRLLLSISTYDGIWLNSSLTIRTELISSSSYSLSEENLNYSANLSGYYINTPNRGCKLEY